MQNKLLLNQITVSVHQHSRQAARYRYGGTMSSANVGIEGKPAGASRWPRPWRAAEIGSQNSPATRRSACHRGDGTSIVDMGTYEFGSFASGDLNCVGLLNALDIDPFVVCLTGGGCP
jgi:hypothetical protein